MGPLQKMKLLRRPDKETSGLLAMTRDVFCAQGDIRGGS